MMRTGWTKDVREGRKLFLKNIFTFSPFGNLAFQFPLHPQHAVSESSEAAFLTGAHCWVTYPDVTYSTVNIVDRWLKLRGSNCLVAVIMSMSCRLNTASLDHQRLAGEPPVIGGGTLPSAACGSISEYSAPWSPSPPPHFLIVSIPPTGMALMSKILKIDRDKPKLSSWITAFKTMAGFLFILHSNHVQINYNA